MAKKKESNVSEEKNNDINASMNNNVEETKVESDSQEQVVVEEKSKEEPTVVEAKVAPQSVSAVKTSTEKPKSFFEKNKAVIILAGIAVIGIIILISLISLIAGLFGSKKIEKPLIYLTSDGELKYITSGKKEGVTIANSYSDSIDLAYPNKSSKYILYTKSDNLYLLNTTKNKESEKITSDVDEFMFSLDDKYIVFTDEDGDLYSYNYKEKTKLDSEISSIKAISNDKVFYRKDGNLYMRSLKSSKDDKVKIVSDYTSAYFNEDMTKVLYSKENNDDLYDYYVYNIKSKKENKVISDAYTVYDYSDDFTKFIYGVKNDGSTFDLSKIVDDDKKEEDANFKAYTYDDYLDGVVDYSTYRKSLSEKYDVEDRNDIREQLEKEFELDPTISVYYQTGDKKTQITKEADKVLYTDADTKRVVYTSVKYNTNKKIKLSEVSYFYKIKNHLNDCKENTVMYKVLDKDAVEVVTGAEKEPKVYVINNDLYYILDSELFYAKINGNKLGKVSSLAEEVTIISSTGDYKDSLIFATDVKNYNGDLKLAKAGKVESIASDVYTRGIEITDTNKIYYYTDYKNNSGDFNMYNGKAKKLITDVGMVQYVKDNYMYVFKDYSPKSSTYDLYTYKGRDLKLVEYDIKAAY